MIILHRGIQLDTSIEQDIRTKSKHGFDVLCLFKKGSYKEDPRNGMQVIHLWHNINQVHSRYLDSLDKTDKIAFESDILGGGGWRYIDAIDVVMITPAKTRHKDYCEVLFLEK